MPQRNNRPYFLRAGIKRFDKQHPGQKALPANLVVVAYIRQVIKVQLRIIHPCPIVELRKRLDFGLIDLSFFQNVQASFFTLFLLRQQVIVPFPFRDNVFLFQIPRHFIIGFLDHQSCFIYFESFLNESHQAHLE